MVYMRERYSSSFVFTFKKIMKSFEVTIDVQKGVARFRNNDVLVSSNLRFHLLLSYDNNP